MGPSAISLRAGAFAFTCPECRLEVSKRASQKTLGLLMAAGAGVVRTDTELTSNPASEAAPAVASASERLPFEDRSPVPGAPPITSDDLIDFHHVLQDDAAIAQFLGLDR
jgi:hypothetical protein